MEYENIYKICKIYKVAFSTAISWQDNFQPRFYLFTLSKIRIRSLIRIYWEEYAETRCTNEIQATKGLASNLRVAYQLRSVKFQLNKSSTRAVARDENFAELILSNGLDYSTERVTMCRV